MFEGPGGNNTAPFSSQPVALGTFIEKSCSIILDLQQGHELGGTKKN
jgi:hypothetical protein